MQSTGSADSQRKITLQTKEEYIATLVSKVERCSCIIERYEKNPGDKDEVDSVEFVEFILRALSPSALDNAYNEDIRENSSTFNTLALAAENATKIMAAAQAELKVLQQ
jgi:hypothetical protein